MNIYSHFVVIISADAEWKVVRNYFQNHPTNSVPFGEWFSIRYKDFRDLEEPVIFTHGGWGKVAAAASTQFAIDQWHPKLVINLGTCGGFEGHINKGEIILVEKTVIYDIYEQMGDPDEHLKYYMTEINTSWITPPYPVAIRRSLLVSGDRDLFCSDLLILNRKYCAIAGDWESGAIAWVANKNQVQCLILRGVTDLVGEDGGEAYNGNVGFYYENTSTVMNVLIDSLPKWLEKFNENVKIE